MEKNNNNLAYISIIAVVAVVGIVGLIMMIGGGSTKQASPANLDFSLGGENLAGDARALSPSLSVSKPITSVDILPTKGLAFFSADGMTYAAAPSGVGPKYECWCASGTTGTCSVTIDGPNAVCGGNCGCRWKKIEESLTSILDRI